MDIAIPGMAKINNDEVEFFPNRLHLSENIRDFRAGDSDIFVDSDGSAYVTGDIDSSSTALPTIGNSTIPTGNLREAYVARLSPQGNKSASQLHSQTRATSTHRWWILHLHSNCCEMLVILRMLSCQSSGSRSRRCIMTSRRNRRCDLDWLEFAPASTLRLQLR
jgi:hypothetical protein